VTFETLHQVAIWLGCQRIDLEACTSTNDEAARMARAGAKHGTVVIAERQDAGRGRDGRTWASPSGGLYLSAILRPLLPLADVPPMTLAIGIGLCDAIRAMGARAELKWPNDVLVGGRKLAGVLVESQSQGGKLETVVVGIGVNLDATPRDVASTAISLAEAIAGSGAKACDAIDREAFIAQLLANVERWIDRYIAVGIEAIVPAWQQRMALGLVARTQDVIGEIAGLDDDGALLLRDDAGQVHRVRSGDVEVIRPAAVLSPTA
jgi:BirA family biotin operon repressor/biotin-[acetyl-CoA-carboxylase] ligase